MAKDSILTGAVDTAPVTGSGNSATNGCSYNGEKGYAERKGGRFPEVNRVTSLGGRQLEKQTPPRTRKG